MTITTYNPATQEGLDFYDHCVEVDKRTNRVIFGQLWVPAPSINDIMKAIYQPGLAAVLFTANPLLAYFKDAR